MQTMCGADVERNAKNTFLTGVAEVHFGGRCACKFENRISFSLSKIMSYNFLLGLAEVCNIFNCE